MPEETLTKKVGGTLRTGSRKYYVLDGCHIIFDSCLDFNLTADELAAEAGYAIGDRVEYEITIRRKSP